MMLGLGCDITLRMHITSNGLLRAGSVVLACAALVLTVPGCDSAGDYFVEVEAHGSTFAINASEVMWTTGPGGTMIAVKPNAIDDYCDAITEIVRRSKDKSFDWIDAQQALILARSNFVNSFLGVIRRREDAERVRADFPEASFEERGPCVGDIEEWGIDAFDGTSQKAWWRVLFMTPFDAWE